MLDLKSGGHSLSSEFAPIAAVEASAAETFADAVRMVRRQVLIVILLGLRGLLAAFSTSCMRRRNIPPPPRCL